MSDKSDKKEKEQKEPLFTDSRFDDLMKKLAKPEKSRNQRAVESLLKGSGAMATRLFETHGKKLSLEGKIVRKDLYFGQGLANSVNPLGIEVSNDPMDLYRVGLPSSPLRQIGSGIQRQGMPLFGVTKLRLY